MPESSFSDDLKHMVQHTAARARERLAVAQSGLQPAMANLRALPKATKIKIAAGIGAGVLLVGGMALRGNTPSAPDRAVDRAAERMAERPAVRTSDLRATPKVEKREAARNYAVGKSEEKQGSYRAAAESYAEAAKKGNKKALSKLVAMTHAKKCEVRSEAADALGTVKGKKARTALKKLAKTRFKDEARAPGIFSCSSKRAAEKALERQTRG
jgi:adenylate cyclase